MFDLSLLLPRRPKFSAWLAKEVLAKVFAEEGGGLKDVDGFDAYSCSVDLRRAAWLKWTQQLPPFAFDRSTPYFNIVVPTEDTTRYRHIVKTLVTNGHGTLLIAETGVGKSVIIQSLLNELVASGPFVSMTARGIFSKLFRF